MKNYSALMRLVPVRVSMKIREPQDLQLIPFRSCEGFKTPTNCTFVINEFNHSVRLRSFRPATLS